MEVEGAKLLGIVHAREVAVALQQGRADVRPKVLAGGHLASHVLKGLLEHRIDAGGAVDDGAVKIEQHRAPGRTLCVGI